MLRRIITVAGGVANVTVALLVLLLIGTAVGRLRVNSSTAHAPSAGGAVIPPQRLVATGESEAGRDGQGNKKIVFEPTDLLSEIKNNRDVLIIDIRGREEFARGHIPSAVNIPGDEIHSRALDELPGSKLLVVSSYACSNDEMSGIARDNLAVLGFTNVAILKDGINGWEQAGFDVATAAYSEPQTYYVSGQARR